MRVILGIGCQREVAAGAVVVLVRGLCADLGRAPSELVTVEARRDAVGLAQAALRLDLPLRFLPLAELQAVDAAVPSRSAAVLAAFGVGSVAEAAALAAAGPGGYLLGPRRIGAGATAAAALSAA